MLSEAIGALALVPLGLLFKPHYLLRHRDPRLLLETLTTLAVTLALSWAAITAAVALHLRDRSADVERRAPAADGSVHGVSGHRDGSVADDCPQSSGADHPARRADAERPWLPFLMLLLPANVMTMVMYAFRAERNISPKAKSAFVTRWNIPPSEWRWSALKANGFRLTRRCAISSATARRSFSR